MAAPSALDYLNAPAAPNAIDYLNAPDEKPNALAYLNSVDEAPAPKPNAIEYLNSPDAPVSLDISGGQRVTATPTIGSDLSHGDVLGAAGLAYENVRRHFSGLIGPTESERIENSVPVTDANGNTTYQYKPLGNRMDQEGGLFTPYLKVEPMQPDKSDSKVAAAGKAIFNIASGVEGSLLSPGGVATFGTSGTAAKVTGGAFSLDMLSNVKDQVESANKADTTQGKVQGYLGAAVSLAMAGLGLKHAASAPTKAEIVQHIQAAPDEILKPAAQDLKQSSPEVAAAAQQELDRRAQQPDPQAQTPGAEQLAPETASAVATATGLKSPDAEPASTTGQIAPVEELTPRTAEATRQAVDASIEDAEKPEESQATDTTEARIRAAYDRVVNDRERNPWGFPDVHISDVIKEAGLPLEEGKAAIQALRGNGVQIGGGDWSLANEEQRAAGLEASDRSFGKDLMMKFDEPDESASKPAGSEGPGAAAASEFPALNKIDITNASANERRVSEGNLRLLNEEVKSNPTTWAAAEDRIDRNPNYAGELVDKIRDGTKNTVDHVEQAALIHESIRVQNMRDQWAERAADPNTPEIERQEAKTQWKKLDDRMNEVDQATKIAGTSAGRALQIRRMQINDDFTFAGLQRRMKTEKGGTLSDAELAKAKEGAAKFEEAKATRDAAEKAAETEKQNADVAHTYEQTIRELKAQISKQPPKPVLDLARKIVDRWKTDADAARTSLRERLGRTSAGVDPTIVLDVARIMRQHVGELGLKAAEIADRVVSEFGDAVKPYLDAAWKKAQELVNSEHVSTSVKDAVKKGAVKVENTLEGFRARAKAESVAGEPLSHKTVFEIAREHIKAGVTGENAVMKYTHDSIREAYPNATERDVRRAYVEYGKVKFPSQDAVRVQERELRSLVQKQESIDRLKAGQDALHSGLQRDKATQLIREKTKELNELLKKREGPPSPEKLASRDEAKQTALRNAIEDLDKQLRTGEKPIKGEPIPDSPKTEQLRAERDAMREKLREIEEEAKIRPTAEETKLAALRQRISDLRERISSGDTSTKAGKPTVDTEEIAKARIELKGLNDQLRDMRKTENPPKTPVERYNETRLRQVQKQLEEAKRRIRESDYASKPRPTPKEKFAAVAHAEAELAKVKEQIRRNIEQIRYDNRSLPKKAWDTVKNALHFVTAVKILGHGTVGMMTHAGGLAWRPTKAIIYWKNFGLQWGLWLNKSYHEQLIYKLKNDPDFQTWKKAGASIDPEHTYTDYGMYAKWLGKLGEAGGRGFDALKLARLELNKSDWAKVPDSIKNDPEAAQETMKRIAEINNKATGAIPKGQDALSQAARNPIADAVFFAPKLYASRWARVVLDPVKTANTFFDWKAASEADRFAATKRLKNAAEFTATLLGSLLVNQALLSATGSPQSVNFKDPTKADWLKFKAGGKEIMADGGLLDPVRLIGQIVWGDLIQNRHNDPAFRGKTNTEKAVLDLWRYARSKLNPTAGLVVDSLGGTDFQGRPLPFRDVAPKYKDQAKYKWGEWVAQQGPIPISGGVKIAYDEMRKKGMSHLQAMDFLKGAAVSAIGTTGVHASEDYSQK